jgi:hypothetical protein
VCKVDVGPAATPVFVRPPGTQDQEFWVRIGNRTRLLSGADVIANTKQHWT